MRTFLIVFCIALLAVPAFAEKPVDKARSAPDGYISFSNVREGEYMSEGFEGAFPPAGWALTASAPSPYTWYQGAGPYSGSSDAHVDWTASYTQDEHMDVSVDLTGAGATDLVLSSWHNGSAYWSGNANTTINISSDGVNYTEVWSMAVDYPASWTWTQAVIDVSAYAGGMLHIRYSYVGTDGADTHVDDVQVGYLAPPPPPPENDTCAGAEANGYAITPTSFPLTGDTSAYATDYPLSYSSCTGYSSSGPDAVYFVDMTDGSTISVTMTCGWDDSIRLITDCADPHNSCVAGADDYPDGSSFSYTHSGATMRYYLIVSGYGSSNYGPFQVDGTFDGAVAIEGSNWGTVKAQYR
jgi:hypothetical protein